MTIRLTKIEKESLGIFVTKYSQCCGQRVGGYGFYLKHAGKSCFSAKQIADHINKRNFAFLNDKKITEHHIIGIWEKRLWKFKNSPLIQTSQSSASDDRTPLEKLYDFRIELDSVDSLKNEILNMRKEIENLKTQLNDRKTIW